MRQFELSRKQHLLDTGEQAEFKELDDAEIESKAKEEYVNDEIAREINAHRRRVVGEEKRIHEEMKRQKEIDMIYEIMKKNATKNEKSKGGDAQPDNITFDYEGKIIQIARPKEE